MMFRMSRKAEYLLLLSNVNQNILISDSSIKTKNYGKVSFCTKCN